MVNQSIDRYLNVWMLAAIGLVVGVGFQGGFGAILMILAIIASFWICLKLRDSHRWGFRVVAVLTISSVGNFFIPVSGIWIEILPVLSALEGLAVWLISLWWLVLASSKPDAEQVMQLNRATAISGA
jgi:hypothetical protein